ncbi:hypothetical protein BDZ85DRAFT_262971 [Elsinoe ampelina]|uniref:F-box domain-containing protein n=1 Tax=Elsinoe ampelina TaxID=302913 RepID=A0A6A6GBV1_9PEZI|nr:hypothetical protein BDZ85DRAFT_262971 [Elsinoe ampelina]
MRSGGSIRSMTLTDLSCHQGEGFTLFHPSKAIVEKLTNLRLHYSGVRTKSWHDYDRAQETIQQIGNCWLRPCQSALTSLTLMSGTAWPEFMHHWSASAPPLPNLKYLALSNYFIIEDHAMDWIISCKKLNTLILRGCSIVAFKHAYVSVQPSDILAGSLVPMSVVERWVHYPQNWSYFFNRIRDKLLELQDFRFGSHKGLLSPPPSEKLGGPPWSSDGPDTAEPAVMSSMEEDVPPRLMWYGCYSMIYGTLMSWEEAEERSNFMPSQSLSDISEEFRGRNTASLVAIMEKVEGQRRKAQASKRVTGLDR